MKGLAGGLDWVALALITAGAAVLRLIHIGQVPPDPFYDAAVRSMALSWHNFFFGAFEPGGSVSIDKPPVDLWLQVASVKLLGFSSTTLKLPEALAGTAAVPLLFAAVRRMWSTPAALAAALALAVLPVEVITSRSDTMDGVMMALIVLALLLIVRACETGSNAWLLAGAAALGVAFDVKLLESLVALPGLAAARLPGAARAAPAAPAAAGGGRRGVRGGRAGVAGSDAAVPAHDRPYAIGSTNGSAWNAAFVFNGTDRLAGKSPEPQSTVYEPGPPLPGGDPVRARPHPDRPALGHAPARADRAALGRAAGARAARGAAARRARADHAARCDGRRPARRDGRPRVRTGARATAAGLGVWMLTGIALFSDDGAPAPRYVEGFMPAVAAMLGIGVAWAAPRPGAPGRSCSRAAWRWWSYYAERLLYGRPGSWWIALAGALGALAFAALARLRVPTRRRCPRALLAGGDARAGAGAAGGAGDPVEHRRDGDRRPRQRRRLRGRAAERRAAAGERLPARPPGQRAL